MKMRLSRASLLTLGFLFATTQGCGGGVDESSNANAGTATTTATNPSPPPADVAQSTVFSTSVTRLKVGPVNWGWAGESNSCLVGKVLLTEYDRGSRKVVWPGCSCDASVVSCKPGDELPTVERTLTRAEADTVEATFGAVTRVPPPGPCAPDGVDWLLSTFDRDGREVKYAERNINCGKVTAKNIGGVYGALYALKPKS
ncbi:MAG: hypothetical protein IPF92_07280 [Myxococcales bacterium]|nr:hypothetical protein [Myxococcales bacterium]